MTKKQPTKANVPVTKPVKPVKVWGHDDITHKRLHLPPGTPGFTPDK